MQGRYGKNQWKIRVLSIMGTLIILGAAAGLCAAGFLFLEKKQAETAQKKIEELQKAFIAEPEPVKQEAEAAEPVSAEPVSAEPISQEQVEVRPSEEPAEPVQAAPVSMEAVTSVSATSALSEYGMTHSPDRILDHDISTAWVEGVSGNGEGESVVFMLNGTYRISGFKIHAGYHKNSDLYSKNARPAQIELSFSNGQTETFYLADQQSEQSFDLQTPADASSITLKILSTYNGWKFSDTVISEIIFY